MIPSMLRRNNRPAVLRGTIAPSGGIYPSGATINTGNAQIRASVTGAPFFEPSGLFSVGPNEVETDGARLSALFDQAAQQLGLRVTSGGSGALEVVRFPTGSVVRTWVLPVNVQSAVDRDALLRAMSRAIYWSSRWFRSVGNQRTQIELDPSDGGSGLANTFRTGAGGAGFSVNPTGGGSSGGNQSNVVLGSVPGSATPPPGPTPTQGDSITPIGGPGQMSVSDLLVSFCNKRPKDSEGALTARDRQEFQAALTRLGYSTQGIDGVIGGNTRTAVQSFQRAQGIASQGQPGYGTIGPQTQAAIIRAVCQSVNTGRPPTVNVPATTGPVTTTTPTPTPTTTTRPSTPSPLANRPANPPAAETTQAGFGVGPVLLLAAAGAAAVMIYSKKGGKSGKGHKS